MSPRILFVSYTADWTGPTHSLLLLLKHLCYRYDVAVLLPGQGVFLEALGREQIPYFSLPTLDKSSILDITRLIRRERFDLVYGNSHDGSARNALIAAKLAGVPFICHIRSMVNGKPWRRSAHLNLADAVIAVSQACANALRGRILNSNKLNVVHNGIDFDTLGLVTPIKLGCLRQALKIYGERPVLISIGHLMPRKAQEYVVQAMAGVIASGADLDLVLVGSHDRDRNYVEHVKTLIDELELGPRVRLTGFRQDAQVLLSLADIYIHTSLNDPHPRSVLEAMAAGLPVVAFAVDGVAETVVDGQTGYLLSPGDVPGMAGAIQRLVMNPSLRAEMGKEGRRRVETCFSASLTAEKVSRIIEAQLMKNYE